MSVGSSSFPLIYTCSRKQRCRHAAVWLDRRNTCITPSRWDCSSGGQAQTATNDNDDDDRRARVSWVFNSCTARRQLVHTACNMNAELRATQRTSLFSRRDAVFPNNPPPLDYRCSLSICGVVDRYVTVRCFRTEANGRAKQLCCSKQGERVCVCVCVWWGGGGGRGVWWGVWVIQENPHRQETHLRSKTLINHLVCIPFGGRVVK